MIFKDLWLQPFLFFSSPEKRIYSVYLISSLVIALIVLTLEKRESLPKILKQIFDKRVWLHSSSLVDYKLFLFNIFFKGILFLFVIFSSFTVAKFTLGFMQDSFVGFRGLRWSSTAEALAYTLGSFVLLDFSRFFQHFCMHRFAFLWRFHQVHHSASRLTPMTLYRTHPVEGLISVLRRTLVVGVSTGLFIFAFGAKINAFDIIGINIIDFVFNILASNLRHSHIWFSFGPFSYIFISPAQHQIHHSKNPKHFNKNLGIVLSLWDQLFGTFYYPKNKEFLRFGLPGEGVWSFKEALLKPLSLKSKS